MKEKTYKSSALDLAAKLAIVLTVIVLTVFFAGNIVIPIIFSGIIAIFLFPIVRFLERIGMNRFFATFTTVFSVSVILIGVVGLLGYQSQQIIASLPDMHVEEIMEEPVEQAEEKMDIELTPYNSYINQALDSAKSSAKTLVPVFIGRVSNTFAFFITCPIYIFFMLLYANNLKSFYFAIFQGEKKQKATAVLKDINGAYANYIKGMAIVITIVSVLTGTGLAILGIDYAIFLGVFAGLMTLIPYIGVFVSAIIPIIIALITKDTFWYAGGVVLVFVIVQVLEGNVITPKIVGDKVGLNPLVVIIGIVIFGAIAGVAGMIITIPVLALFKIIAEHAPGWEPIKLLLKA